MGRSLPAEVRQVQITTADMGGHWCAYCGFDYATGKDRLSAVRALCHLAELELIDEVVEGAAYQLQLFDTGLYNVRAERAPARGGDGASTGDADHAGTGSGCES